ncbi:MAG: hypothetical protein ACK5H2_14340 [Beutenbergiaceae bacterium]
MTAQESSGEPEPDRPTTHLTELARGPQLEWPDDDVPRAPLTKAWLPLLVGALVCLGASFAVLILPLVLLTIGLLLLWRSPLWTTRERAIVTAGSIVLTLYLPVMLLILGGRATVAQLAVAMVVPLALYLVLLLQIGRGRRRVKEFD